MLFAINIILTAVGFYYLYSSPFTGLMISMQMNQAIVRKVDKGSPAEKAGVNKGDVLLDVEGMGLPYFTFSPDPDYVSSRKDYKLLWKSIAMLDTSIRKNKPLELSMKRDGAILKFLVTPTNFPFLKALRRTLPAYIVAWVFMIVGFLVLRKKANEMAVANFIIGTGVCASLVSFAPYTVRDLAYPYAVFRIIKETNYIGSLLAPFGFLHLILVFPRRRPFVEKYPWLIKAVYVTLCLIFFIHYAEFFNNMHLTVYLPISMCLFGFLIWLLYDFFREKNLVFKKQIQWVVFGFAIGISAWLALTSIPVMFGAPLLSEEVSLLPAILIPLSFAFAITRYRLMDIDTLFDYTIIFGTTILILEGIELAFWGIVVPYFNGSVIRTPIISLVAVLLIVFAYMPVRNTVKRYVEHVFKRGIYNFGNVIQQFVASINVCNGGTLFEKFASFVKELLGPSGCFVLRGGKEIVYADSEIAKLRAEEMYGTENLVEYFSNHRQVCFGYEISEAGHKIGDNFEGVLFVPVFTEKDLYIVVFLEKWNGTAYSRKDCTLLNALSINLGHVMEAERLRMETQAIKEEFNKQRDYVIKEMHDGLGNILTNITVASQVAEKAVDNNRTKAKEMLSWIIEHSQEAMEFMRVGLSVLDNTERTTGLFIATIRYKYLKLLESSGINVRFFAEDDVYNVTLDAKANLNLLRVFQEALNNILKHSGSKNVNVKFLKDGANLKVFIHDDGKGFDAMCINKGLGIENMKRRIEALGGLLSIKSKLGAGTEIVFCIPLKSPAKVI